MRYGLSAESAAKIDIVREAGLKSDEFSIRAQVLTPAEIIGRRDLSCLTGQGERIPLVMKGGRLEFNELH
ncbi:hypothetical protein [Paraburkholderia youngii]|uniref:hypothetical protein n=1 Tax=Paraburkholderia youngii TaxID=2782701 RepID=UPI003D22C9C4